MIWTTEKLSALAPLALERLRQNAIKLQAFELVNQIETLQVSRRTTKNVVDLSPVVGFHFVCPEDYEVTFLEGGKFRSGVWYVKSTHCDPAMAMRGYVALHRSRSSLSHRQGTIVGWSEEKRTKGKKQFGITFELEPFDGPLRWYGQAAGERGYRRVGDDPPWTPMT